jgi:phosphatidylglycerol lysyltransferase
MIGGARRLLERVVPFLGVAVFVLALLALRAQLGEVALADVPAAAGEIPVPALLAAVGLTLVSFLVLTGYDRLALSYARQPLERARSGLAAFLAYAFSQALGFPLFTGAPIRYRLYAAWGLDTVQVLRVVAFCAATFWVGLLAVGGVLFLVAPPAVPIDGAFPEWALRPVGALFLAVLAGYLLWARAGRPELRVAGIAFAVPGRGLAFRQILLAAVDWIVAASVLYVLLPAGHGVGMVHFLAIFVAAQFAGQLSHVPGGLGVVEAVILFLLPEAMADGRILGSFLVWRGIYHLLPLLLAVGVLGFWELRARGAAVERTLGAVGRGALLASPVLLAGGTFVAGVLLVVYGSVPPAPGHLAWVDGLLPHGAFELSHFLASLAGAALLVLAWGLVQRLEAAYRMTLVLLATGIVLSLLRGFEVLPAATLGLILLALLPARRKFFRKASLTAEPFSPGWTALIVGTLAAAVWFASLSYRHVDMSSDLWWSFTLTGDASRSVRALTGVSFALLLFGVVRLLRPSVPPALIRPPGEIPPEVEAAARASPRSGALMALTGDKSFLLSRSGKGFIMYGVEGRAWVSLGDPVGPAEVAEELVWRFRKLAFRYRGWPVFYQARPDRLPLYLDAGLSLMKLGEEARVPLESFTLEGGRWKEFRQTLNRAEREGTTFECLRGGEVEAVLPELRAVSDEWLASKNVREKGFSVGSFHEPYLRRTPVGVARQGGRISGFVNLLMPDEREEFTADLMRYRTDAMKGVMEFLFAHAMLLGKEEGYRHFSLGMAPFSGLDTRPLAPLRTRLGAAVFRHGEHFYNFRGLRAYKEKFHPEWSPRYVASPGGLAVPRILASVGSLIAGGLTGMVRR